GDVGAQRAQVAVVRRAPHDDERVAVTKARPRRRQLDPPSEQLALLADVVHRVRREGRDRLVDSLALSLEHPLALRQAEDPPGGERRAVTVDLAGEEDDRLAIAKLVEQRGGRSVDEADAGARED